MDDTAVFKLTYGLFYIGSENKKQKNVCVVNTVAQLTQEPLRVSVTILKSNLTAEIINETQKFSVGIIGISASMSTIQHFGGQSGHTSDKLANQDYTTDVLGNPLISENCIATLCCKVCQTVDLDTHFLFIADLVDAQILSNEAPMTYRDYRNIRSGANSQDNFTSAEPDREIWQCTICHYIYDGDIPFEDLPDDYVCPICHQPKSVFKKV